MMANRMPAERSPDLHELKACFELFHQDVTTNGTLFQTKMALELVQDVIPQSSFFCRLDLWQVKGPRGAFFSQLLLIVDHVECRIDDRCGEAPAIALSHVTIIQM